MTELVAALATTTDHWSSMQQAQTALFSAVGTHSWGWMKIFAVFCSVRMSKKQGTACYYWNNYGNVLWKNEVIKGEHVHWWGWWCIQMMLHSRARWGRSGGGGRLWVKFASSFSTLTGTQFVMFTVMDTLAVTKVPLLLELLLNIFLNLKFKLF